MEISPPSKESFSFFNRYGDLYQFCVTLLFDKSINSNDIILEQTEFLQDLMNQFEIPENNRFSIK